jgi:imidazolonepropionase-like amidohydrolase
LSICLCKLGFNRKEVEQSKPIEENGAKIKGVDEDYGTIEEGREAGGSGGN